MLGRKNPAEPAEPKANKLRASGLSGESPYREQNEPSQKTTTEGSWGLSSSQKTPIGRGGKTRIAIHFDVGFSNSLYIRGKGAPGLSWDRGVQLKNVKSDLWVWESDVPFTTAEFKVLINDRNYEEGENRTLKYGAQLDYTPHFAHAHA